MRQISRRIWSALARARYSFAAQYFGRAVGPQEKSTPEILLLRFNRPPRGRFGQKLTTADRILSPFDKMNFYRKPHELNTIGNGSKADFAEKWKGGRRVP